MPGLSVTVTVDVPPGWTTLPSLSTPLPSIAIAWGCALPEPLSSVSVTAPAFAVSVFLSNDRPLLSTACSFSPPPVLPAAAPPDGDAVEVVLGAAEGVELDEDFELEPQALSARAPAASAEAASAVFSEDISYLSSRFRQSALQTPQNGPSFLSGPGLRPGADGGIPRRMLLPLWLRAVLVTLMIGSLVFSFFGPEPRTARSPRTFTIALWTAVGIWGIAGWAMLEGHLGTGALIITPGVEALCFAVWISRNLDDTPPDDGWAGEGPKDVPPDADWERFERAFRAWEAQRRKRPSPRPRVPA